MDAPPPFLVKNKDRFDRLIDWIGVAAGVMLVSLVVLVCIDVFVRNVVASISVPWIPELNEYLLYAITFMGSPWVLRERGHIIVDLVTQTLSPKNRRRAEFLTNAMGAFVCLVLCYYSVAVLIRSYNAGNQVVKTYTFPEWWPMVIVPPVFLLLAIIFIRWLVRPPGVIDDQDLTDGI